jgi:hypothetical protein
MGINFGNISLGEADARYNKKISIAVYEDQKASGTQGGGSSVGKQTRDLNTQVSDDDNIGSLSANAVTLEAGKYHVSAKSSGYRTGLSRLYINDGTSDILTGNNVFINTTDGGGVAEVEGVFTADGVKAYSVRMYCGNAQASDGLGNAIADGVPEVYTQVTFTRI